MYLIDAAPPAAQQVGASAFAVGSHLVFGAGAYVPGTSAGEHCSPSTNPCDATAERRYCRDLTSPAMPRPAKPAGGGSEAGPEPEPPPPEAENAPRQLPARGETTRTDPSLDRTKEWYSPSAKDAENLAGMDHLSDEHAPWSKTAP